MRRVAIINHTAPPGAGHFGCLTVMKVLEEALTHRGCEIALRVPVTVDWRNLNPELLGDLDAIVVNGEGSIHHTATRRRVAGLAQLGPYARDKLGVPAYLINATLYALDEAALTGIAGFNRVFVRDSASLDELAGHQIEAEFVPDLTLGFDFPKSYARVGYTVTDSVLPDATKKLQRISQAQNWPFGKIRARPETKDRPAIETPADFAQYLASRQGVLTGRFHAATFCVGTRTPFVAIESNTPKISSLCQDIWGRTDRVMDLSTFKARTAKPLLHWRDGELEAVNRYVETARQRIDQMFDDIC